MLGNLSSPDSTSLNHKLATDVRSWQASLPAQALDATITTRDITEAITTTKRDKAPGPDGLGNDFYIDYAAQVAPILEKGFDHC